MRLQRLTNYLLTHRWEALALTVLVTALYAVPGGSLISGLGIIFAALVTLVKGPKEGLLFTLAATLPYMVIAIVWGGYSSLLPTTLVGVFIFSNILTWVFAVMLYRKATWSQILQIEALIGVFAVSVVHLVYPGVVEWWASQIMNSLLEFKKVMVEYHWDISILSEIPMIAAQSAQTATGFTADSVLVVNIMQLIIARWWQASVFDPGSLGRELRYIRLGHLAGIFFMASFVLLYYGNSVILDIMPVLVLLFAMAGLSLVHYFFSLMPRTPTTWFWLILMYAVIIYSSQISILLLAIFALFDVWLDVRKRFKKV